MPDSQMQQYQNMPQMCFVVCPQGMPFQNMLPFQLPLGMQVAPPVACQVPPPPPPRQQHNSHLDNAADATTRNEEIGALQVTNIDFFFPP